MCAFSKSDARTDGLARYFAVTESVVQFQCQMLRDEFQTWWQRIQKLEQTRRNFELKRKLVAPQPSYDALF
jgi:hypothetical protein